MKYLYHFLMIMSFFPTLLSAADCFGCDDPEYRVVKLAINDAGIPWVLARKLLSDQHHHYDYRVLYYKDQRLLPCSPPISFKGATGTCSLYGGRGRDVWLAERRDEQQCSLIKLGTDGAERRTSFISDSRDSTPEIYVAKDGRVFNWGESFLAVLDNKGEWQHSEAHLPCNDWKKPPLIFEIDGRVYFFVTPYLYIVESDGKIEGIKVESAPAAIRQSTTMRWGAARIVVFQTGFHRRKPQAFNIFTGKAVAFPDFEAQNNFYSACFSTRDGTLWFNKDIHHTYTDIERRTALLPPEATEYTLFKGLRCPEKSRLICFEPRDILFERSDGLLISGEDGITIIRPPGSFIKYGIEYGLGGVASDIHEDKRGNLWFVMDGQLRTMKDPVRHIPKQIASPWQEFEIQPETWLFQPAPGEIAYFAKDKSTLRKWDGYKWSEESLAFAPVKMATYDNAFTEGKFIYPVQEQGLVNNNPVYRVLDNEKMRIRLDASPLTDGFPMRICEDKAGDVWILAAKPQNIRTFEIASKGIGMRASELRLFKFTPEKLPESLLTDLPESCGRSLTQRLDTSDFARAPSVFGRAGSGSWRKCDPATKAMTFLFPSNGTYTCEICAFDNGIRFKGSRSFAVTASVQLPDTRTAETTNNLIYLSSRKWHPSVSIVPTATVKSSPTTVEWREKNDAEWKSINPRDNINIAEYENGNHIFLFRAVENRIWRDPTPVELSVFIQLSIDERLLDALAVLKTFNEPSRKPEIFKFIQKNAEKIKQRLAKLREQADDLRLVEQGEQFYSTMQNREKRMLNAAQDPTLKSLPPTFQTGAGGRRALQ